MSTAVVLGRTVRAEWARLWSLRSTWIMVAGIALAVLGLATLAAFDAARGAVGAPADDTAWETVRFTTMFALLGVVALSVMATTGDYASGGIVPTLQWTPRRAVLLTGRSAVVSATCAGLTVLLLGAGAAVVALVAGLDLAAGAGTGTLAEMALVVGSGALLGVGLGMLTRSTAGGLVIAVALLLVLPLVLGNLPYDWAVAVASRLPGAGAIHLVFGGSISEDMTAASARGTLLAWAAAAMVLGGVRLLRTDASR